MKRNSRTRSLLFFVLATLACCALLFAGCGQSGTSSATGNSASGNAASSTASSSSASEAQAEGPYASGIHHAVITVKGYDPITVELNADAAPATVANFCALANDGYYNGLTFYRFVDGFCMQGGTKGNSASGHDGSLTPIVGEFSANGHDNELANDFGKGTVAMARTGDPDSATSTFFITLDSSVSVSQSLNGQYAAFGTIDADGMAIVDKIVQDYLPNVTDAQMGAIADEANQAPITSIEITD